MTRRMVPCVALLAMASPVAAEEVIPGHTVDYPVDGAITAIAGGVSLASFLIPIRGHEVWDRQLFAWDERLFDQFSRRASAVSDGLFGLSIVAPAIYLTGSSIDDADADRLMIYGESIAINTALVAITKRLVQRPRPYRYSRRPSVIAYARDHANDSMQSFYSGHSALTFGAAVTGAYLLGASEESRGARMAAWGAGLGVASATATLRVRAGKHFYSDVLVGALVGISVGYAVPALHADTEAYTPSGEEVAIGMAGIVGGLVLASLLPLESRSEADAPPARASLLRRVQLAPAPMQHGMGFAVGGAW